MKKQAFSAFEAADYLKSEEEIAAYLEAATEDGDPQVLVAAMGDVVKARNLSKVARDTGLTREGIYKALSAEGNPSFATVCKLANALDIRVSFRPKEVKSPSSVKGPAKGKPAVRAKDSAKAGRRTAR